MIIIMRVRTGWWNLKGSRHAVSRRNTIREREQVSSVKYNKDIHLVRDEVIRKKVGKIICRLKYQAAEQTRVYPLT